MGYPNKKQRLLSILVDMLVLFVVITGFKISGIKSFNAVMLLYFAIASYFPAFHCFLGKTPGDMVLKLKVINNEGTKPGFWEVTDRFFGVFTKLYILNMMFESVLMLLAIFGTGTIKDIVNDPLDYERESKTYLIIDNNKGQGHTLT